MPSLSLPGNLNKYIHVNQHNIKHNKKHGGNLPVITTKVGSKNGSVNHYGSCVEICDKDGNTVARLVYEEEGKLKCGAVVFIETENPVNIIDPQEWADIVEQRKAEKGNG